MLARWQDTIVDARGLPAEKVTIAVWRDEPGSPVPQLFADADGKVPMSNPFYTSGTAGRVAFYVENGVYQVNVTVGEVTQRWRNVGIGAEAEPYLELPPEPGAEGEPGTDF